MTRKTATEKYNGIGSEAVKAKTGRGWHEWFAVLDRAGARKMNHTQIASHLHSNLGVTDWWSQMVTVGYEQARGLRVKHQRPDGYSISVSRTIGVPQAKLFTAWRDVRARSHWLPKAAIDIRTAKRPRSMRITWTDRKTSLLVNFFPKGVSRGQVVVEHSRLPDAKAAEKMKGYWAKTLDRLRVVLES